MTRTITTLFASLTLLGLPVALADYPLGPGAPANLAAVAGPGAGAISLAWEPAASLAGVTSYQVYALDAEGATTLVGATNGTTLGFVATGLGNGATATFVVTASDALGEGPASLPATATTFTAPSSPESVSAKPGAPGTVGEIVVSWSAPLSDGGLAVGAYNIYRDGELVATVDGQTLSWTDTGREVLHDANYAVSALNEAGESQQSASSCSLPSPWGILADAPSCLGIF